MAEILIPLIVGTALFTLTLYLIMCIYDSRNPIKFWHTHTWKEVYNNTVEGYRGPDYDGYPARKSLVIVNQCTICKKTRMTEDKIF